MTEFGSGECKVCGSLNIEYGDNKGDISDNIIYPYTCCECGHEGNEYYAVEYVESD